VKRIVLDASAVVAILTADHEIGPQAAEACADAALAAPALLPFEVANVLRRLESGGRIDATTARLAHADLLDLRIDLWPYEAIADRVRALRGALSAYDASYVAVAEATSSTLLTLDARLSRANGMRCEIHVVQGA